jgi:hypothetical protein
MESENSRLERLKRSLYSRNEDLVPKEKRTPVSGREYDVAKDWSGKSGFDFSDKTMQKKNNSFFNKFFLISIVFFILALGVAAFIFFGGFNMISSNNVDIQISGPSSISSGEELDLNLSVVNQNKVPLQNVKLSVNYPTNTQVVDGSGKSLSLNQFVLDDIPSGQVKNQSVRAILFGPKDSVQTISLQLEYTVSGSNAVFSKEKDYTVSISSSPLLLNVSYPQEINSGQDVTLSINLTSNSSVVISGALVKVQYPYGFTYESSNIKPARNLTLADSLNATSTTEQLSTTSAGIASSTSGNLGSGTIGALWNLGDMKNGDSKTLTITGTLVGQDMENRSFDVSVGVPQSPGQLNFSAPLAEQLATVGIRKSFFNLSIVNPSNSGATFGQLGQPVSLSLQFQNTLPDKVVNNQITINLSGNVFNPSQVSAGNGGFYSSLDDSILWNKNTTDTLSQISPGDSGQVSFSLSPLGNQSQPVKNPHIDIVATMSGSRTGSEASDISSTQNLTFKFISTLGLSAQSYRSVGPLSNTGPIPPKANIESTYTITWTLTNTANDLTGATVSATLPVGIVWKGLTDPASEHITYNPDSRLITWSVGDVSSGTGFTYSPRTVSFQVSLTPSLTQVGQPVDLLPLSQVSATDTYAQTTISANAPDVSTRFADPGFVSGDEMVTN